MANDTDWSAVSRVTAQGNFAEPVAADLITQILDGVAYLHNLGARLQGWYGSRNTHSHLRLSSL